MNLVNTLSEDLSKKNSGSSRSSSGAQPVRRSKSALPRLFSNKSFKRNASYDRSNQESQPDIARDLEIA